MGIKPTQRTYRKWIILPCCLLIFGILEELLYYKLELIANRYIRIGVMMFFYVAGISLAAFVLTPWLEKFVISLHKGTRKGFGILGELIFISILIGATYFFWYVVFIEGPEALLPKSWHNPFLARFIK